MAREPTTNTTTHWTFAINLLGQSTNRNMFAFLFIKMAKLLQSTEFYNSTHDHWAAMKCELLYKCLSGFWCFVAKINVGGLIYFHLNLTGFNFPP